MGSWGQDWGFVRGDTSVKLHGTAQKDENTEGWCITHQPHCGRDVELSRLPTGERAVVVANILQGRLIFFFAFYKEKRAAGQASTTGIKRSKKKLATNESKLLDEVEPHERPE